MTGVTNEVTMQNFETIVDTQPIVILDFWAEWCGPCKIFSPLFDQMAELHSDVYFGKVNTEVAKDLAEAFQVRSIPTLMAFIRGELVFEQPGLLQPQAFSTLIDKLKEKAKTVG